LLRLSGPRPGQFAYAATCWLTEPSTSPAKRAGPRPPTTSRSAFDYWQFLAVDRGRGRFRRHADQHVRRGPRGAEAARQALAHSVTGLTRERARYIEQMLVRGDPAQALLDTVDNNNPANLMSATAGWARARERMFAAGEEWMFAAGEAGGAAADDVRAATPPDPGGRAPTG
jgi:hypothetical protein